MFRGQKLPCQRRLSDAAITEDDDAYSRRHPTLLCRVVVWNAPRRTFHRVVSVLVRHPPTETSPIRRRSTLPSYPTEVASLSTAVRQKSGPFVAEFFLLVLILVKGSFLEVCRIPIVSGVVNYRSVFDSRRRRRGC